MQIIKKKGLCVFDQIEVSFKHNNPSTYIKQIGKIKKNKTQNMLYMVVKLKQHC